MRWVLVLVACGGAPPAGPPPPPLAAKPAPTPVAKSISPAAACARLEAVSAERCGNFARLAIHERCPAMMTEMMKQPGGADLARCVVEHAACADVQACMAADKPAAPEHVADCSHHAPNAKVGVADYD